MASLFPQFKRLEVVYKILNETPFPAAILIPKSLKPSEKPSPLLVHFHGGGLYMGTYLEPAFISKWTLELVQSEGAILVSPAYRLLPEANGSDILNDVADFWEWVRSSLPGLLAEKCPGLSLDLGRTAVVGESAGGYLSLQSAFLWPEARIRVVLAQYCGMYPDITNYNQRPAVVPPEADEFIDRYLAQIKPGTIRLSSPYPAMMDLGLAMRQTGRHREWLGNDERLTLGYGLKTAKSIPPMWVMQGKDDQIIGQHLTDELVQKIRELRPEVPILYSVQPGDHGFDTDHGQHEEYIKEGIGFVKQYWP